MKRILLLLVFMIPEIFPVFGQSMVYPVQVNVNLLPPYSLYLSDYVSGSRDRLVVTLLNRDLQYPSMPVRLRLTVKGNGFSVQTRPYAAVTPIVLEPNIPYRLTISDLQPYFDTRNLSAQGLGGDSYLKGGRLPEGMTEFGIEVLEYGTGKLLSQKGVGTAWLVLQKPPQLSLPFDGEVLPWREPLNLLFQWTPQHSGGGRVEYELVIKELWDNGLAAESAFAYSPEIFRERVTSTSYLYGPQSPPLEAGHRYAWMVRVVAKDGVDDVSIFENEGKSVVRSFRIDRNCPVPTQIKAGAERGYIAVEWEGAPEHIGYAVSYRLSGSEEWTDVKSTFPSAMLSGVRPGNTYEYRVAGFCVPGIPTYNNTTGTITLPSEDTVRMRNCGLLRPVDLSNQQPLEELSAGDQFMAGDFPVTVTDVTGSQGYYTGTGSVNVPFLAGAKFKVAFDHIFLNTDRRMVRGAVNTVYDATESGITNLDDIFVGGSETGKVMAGITKTDLSADFVIDKDAEVYFDESENQIIVKGDDGQVIGYIDAGEAGMEREEAGGNNGNEPSVFPMTIKDKEGNLYRVDKAPEDVLPEGEEAEGTSGQATARPPKKLVVTPLGKSGEKLTTDEVDLKRLDSDVAEVIFTDVEGSRYAFDGWKDVYARSILIRQKYEQIGSDYHVASKLIPPGKSDRVGAEIRLKDESLDPEKVMFRTSQGTEFQVESFDRKKGRYMLTLVGGDSNDGQEVYALYPKPGGGYYNLGKLLVVSYPEYKFRVKIVPLLGDFGSDFPSLKSTLESVYSRVGIGCEVTLDAYFEYADPLLFDKGSGLLSAYNGKMKALNEAYASARGVEKEVSYIFVTGYSGGSGKRDFSGFMPLNSQFGYVSRYDFRSVDKFCIAVAHELAHGRFSLRHPFDSSLGLDEGDVAENLMDYRNGRELSKWQWDVMHDPGVVVRLFERDQDAAMQQKQDTVKERIKIEMYNDEKKFEKGSYQLISAHPAMPKLSFKVSDTLGIIGKVKFRLKIEYRRDNRSDEDYFPGQDKFEETDVGSSWVVDWQNKIRGGKATLICHTDHSEDTVIFYIRGTNPTEQEIKNFLVQEGYSTNVWFLTRMIRQESQYGQFNSGTKYGSEWTSSVGCPNWGSPHGWGLMQLDVLNSSCGELNKDGKYRPSAEALWNWKENLKVGYAFLTREKKSIVRDKIKVYENGLEKWYEKNLTDSIAGYRDQLEGRVTFTHASSSHFNFDWGILDSGLYSFMDAMWIKSYNGNSRGFYYELVVPDDEELKPYWQLNRLNSDNHNYVEAVGNQNE